MKRILHVIDSMNIGGAERLLVDTVNNLEGFEHHIIALSSRKGLENELRPEIKLTQLDFRGKRDIFRCVSQIKHYIRQHKIDVVHSHLVLANIIARLSCPAGTKLFNSLHNLNGMRFFSSPLKWQRWAEKLTYKKRHHLIAVSEAVLKDYDKYIGVKGASTVLYNFVSDRFFAEAPKKSGFASSLKMVSVGSLKQPKNYDYLLRAFEKLSPAFQLDIYGDGPLKEELGNKIQERKLNIRLLGNMANIEEVLPRYDLFVMSSTYEGHPIALLEAMACGMPALVSDIPVLREATQWKGLYFSLDSIEDFLQMISRIMNKEVDLDKNAALNFAYANKTGRKDVYLKQLGDLYHS